MIKPVSQKEIYIQCTDKDGRKLKAPVCPGCWNSKTGRAFLLSKLQNLELKPANKKDLYSGQYIDNVKHLLNCPNEDVFC